MRQLELEGDITDQVARKVIENLKPLGYDTKIKLGNLEQAAGVFPNFEMVATAGALAAVLSFVLELFKTFNNKFKFEKKLKPEALLKEKLDFFNALDFKLIEIRNINGLIQQPPRDCTVILKDVPGGQYYNITITPFGVINLKRLAAELKEKNEK